MRHWSLWRGRIFRRIYAFVNQLRDELSLSSTEASWVFSLTSREEAFEGAIVGCLIDEWCARKIMMVGVSLVGVGVRLP